MAYTDTIFNTEQSSIQASESLKSLQTEAKSSFLSKGIPTMKDEEWKFTNLAKVFKNDYAVSASTTLELDAKLTSFDQYQVVLQNGVLDTERTNIIGDSSIEIADLADKLKDKDLVINL